MKKFKFNNIEIKDIGLIVSEGAGEKLSQEEYETIKVEGMNGSLIVNKGTYPDIEKTFVITALDYVEEEDIGGLMDSIKQLLFNIQDNRLYYSYEYRYNLVKKVIISEDIKTSFENFGDFAVTFLCEPFYYIDEDPVEILKISEQEENTITFRNEGDFKSLPIIEVYGIGDLEFVLNGEVIRIENANGYVKIDSKLLICVDDEGANKAADINIDFPMLPIGNNSVSIFQDSLVEKIIITKRTTYR